MYIPSFAGTLEINEGRGSGNNKRKYLSSFTRTNLMKFLLGLFEFHLLKYQPM